MDYTNDFELSLDESCNLFDAFHYYGKHHTLELAEIMLLEAQTLPLRNHWSSFDEFLVVWDFFYKNFRELPRSFFGKVVVEGSIPESMELSQAQRELFSDPREYKRQACYLLSFFDSISDCFEYEVTMIEKGYPNRYRSVS